MCLRVALLELLLAMLLILFSNGEIRKESVHPGSIFAEEEGRHINTEKKGHQEHISIDDQAFGKLEPSLIGYANSHTAMLLNRQGLPPKRTDPLGKAFERYDREEATDDPCPSAVSITPCVCSVDTDSNVSLDCSEVESEEQLANVFQQDFPVKEFKTFTMYNNSAVATLGNILNGVSFQRINLFSQSFVLKEITDYFLLGNKDSLTYLSINYSNLTSEHFPFSILGAMEKLTTIFLYHNDITWIPKILAPNLLILHMDDAKTEIIEEGTFPVGEGDLQIHVMYSNISSVQPGSFYFVDDKSQASHGLLDVNFYGNFIVSLEPGTFVLRDGPMAVWLGSNELVSIAPGTIVMPPTTEFFSLALSLQSNKLETFDEEVFGELMPYVDQLLLFDNPLLCGCDVAWFISNPSYMALLDSQQTACANGTLLEDLDPAVYAAVC